MDFLKKLSFTWYFLLICQESRSQNSFWYHFDGSASLEVNYLHNPDKQTWSLHTYKTFPEQEVTVNDTILPGNGRKMYTFPAGGPQKTDFRTGGKVYTLLLLPGSKLTCTIDFAAPQKISYPAHDDLSAVCNYLYEKDFSGQGSFKNRRSAAVRSARDLTEFKAVTDSLYNEELHLFNRNKNRVPEWYKTYEYWEIRYGDASLRLNAIPQREYSRQTGEPVPPGYYDFLESLPVDNASAKYSYSYYFFLYELFNRELNAVNSKRETRISFVDYQIAQADARLSGDVRDCFKAFILQMVYNYYNRGTARGFLENNKNLFHNPVWRVRLESYFESKEKYADKGKVPPNFVLADLRDSLVSLRSLKGNVILLSFWFAGCKACAEEFPAENALVAKFRDKPVKVVSVCVNTTEMQWKQWSKRFDLKTINLWANKEWEPGIIEKYGLHAFPRYVLIDQDHKIAEINALRPGQGLEDRITALLQK